MNAEIDSQVIYNNFSSSFGGCDDEIKKYVVHAIQYTLDTILPFDLRMDLGNQTNSK